jgi:histidinol-phosphate aminotransferase
VLKARDSVLAMKEYHPPLSDRRGLRLDFNENTGGCSPKVLERLRQITADDLTRYPERAPVETQIAATLGVLPEQVLLTNGVDEAIHLLCETFLEPADEAIVVVPTFAMYELFVQQTGAKIITVQSDAADFAFPQVRVLAAITSRTRFIAFASPNNPTGAVIKRHDLLAILRAAPHAVVLLDEAYCDFHGEIFLTEINNHSNLFVARTFSKAYGLAGFRTGFLAANADSLKMVRRVASPYNVNGVSLACLESALDDSDFISDYVRQVVAGRGRLEQELTSLGLRHWPSHANFVLVRIGERHKDFVSSMRERGILVRDRDSDPGCAGCVRITIGTTEQTQRFLLALREVCAELHVGGATRTGVAG